MKKNSLVRHSFTILAVLAMIGTGFLSSSANATTINPGQDDCAVTVGWSVPSAGNLKVTWTRKCSFGVYMSHHGIVLQIGSNLKTGSTNCTSNAGDIKTCSGSVTLADPNGLQSVQTVDYSCLQYTPYDPGCIDKRTDTAAISH